MGKNTSIGWTDHTFNPVWGCQRVSPGCENCYAETWAKRTGHQVWGPAKTTSRRTFGEKHWAEPRRWNATAAEEGVVRRRVFCASMADVFEDHPQLPPEREKLWALIDETPALDWLLLTKRTENVFEMAPWGWDFPANVWIGGSAENQEMADKRVADLQDIPAAVRFLSCEPLIGPIALRQQYRDSLEGWRTEPIHVCGSDPERCYAMCPEAQQVQTYPIDWVICGAESGPGARPMDVEWARSLRDQCYATARAFYMKQMGSVYAREHGSRGKGEEFELIPEDLRIREFPTVAVSA